MSKGSGMSNSTLGVIVGLVISIWWIFMGLDSGFRFQASDHISYLLTLGERRHTIMTVWALILIPLCAVENKWGLLAAMVLGIVTFILSTTHAGYMVLTTPPGFESQLFGPIVWSAIQIPIVIFGYKARRELTQATIERGT